MWSTRQMRNLVMWAGAVGAGQLKGCVYQRQSASDYTVKGQQRVFDEDIFCYDEIKRFRHQRSNKNNDIKLLYNRNARHLAIEVAAVLDIELTGCQMNPKGDSETLINLMESVRDKDVYILGQVTRQSDKEELSELLLLVSCCKRAFAKKVTLVLPYMPYTATHNYGSHNYLPQSDMPKLLETVGTDQVITLNCNDPTIKGFFAIPFINLDLTGMASEYLVHHHQIKDPIVVTPDAHKDGIRNAISMISHLEMEGVSSRLGLLLSEFHRKEEVESKYSYLGPDQNGKDVIIVDKKIVTARTLMNAVESARAKGARRVFSFVPHSKMQSESLQALGQSQMTEFLTTNSIPILPHEIQFFKVFSVGKLLAECISRLHHQHCQQTDSAYSPGQVNPTVLE